MEASIRPFGSINRVLFWLSLIAATVTALYIFRLIILTFHGNFRGGIDAVPMKERLPDEAHHQVHRAESPLVMLFPMAILGILSVVSGIVLNGMVNLGPIPAHWLSHFLGEESPVMIVWIAMVASMAAAIGISIAYVVYQSKHVSLDRLPSWVNGLSRVLMNRYYMDYVYERLIVRRMLFNGMFFVADWLDRKVVDGAVDLIGWFGRNVGRFFGQLQTGQVQVSGFVASVGAIALIWNYLVRG